MYRILCLAGITLGSGCVSYVADATDAASIAVEVRKREGGTFTFETAVELAFRQNPELRALSAKARAAAADRTPFEILGQLRSHNELFAVMVDPIALLDLGPRGASNAALDERAAVAAVELVNARWQVAADLAETFAVEAVLANLPAVPTIAVDAAAFEGAGLAAPVDAARFRSAAARVNAERAELATARRQNRNRFCRLIGLPPTADARFETGTFSKPPVRAEHALLARPDVTLALARFGRADADFRAAVAAQYPSITLGPDIPISGGVLEWMAMLRLPVGAAGRATAAGELREAARAELEGTVINVMQEVHDTEATIEATRARAEAARAAATASSERMQSALAAIEVDIDAFKELSRAAEQAAKDATALRLAEVARRLAEHRLDVAFGWPAVVREES